MIFHDFIKVVTWNQLHTMKEETLRPSENFKKSEAMVVPRPGSQMEEIGLMEQRD